MKLGFEESQTPYDSGSQQARVWTESWVAREMFCANCGNPRLTQLPNNSPVADFVCSVCADQFEVKSKRGLSLGTTIADGAYDTKISRLNSATNPHLLMLNYDLAAREVRNVCIVPKHFFVPEIIQAEFELQDVYAFEQRLSAIYPDNNNVRPKIRQQLQVLRDNGYLKLLGGGRYRLRQPD